MTLEPEHLVSNPSRVPCLGASCFPFVKGDCFLFLVFHYFANTDTRGSKKQVDWPSPQGLLVLDVGLEPVTQPSPFLTGPGG